MNLKEIREELLQAAELIADYEQANHSLDMDTAMVKIRRAYEALRFYDFGQIDAAQPCVSEDYDNQQVEESESEKEIEVELLMSDWGDDEYVDNEGAEDEPVTQLNDAVAVEPMPAPVVEEPAPIVEPTPEPAVEHKAEEEPVVEAAPEPVAVVEEAPEVEPTPEPMSEAEAVVEESAPIVDPTPEAEVEVVEPTPEVDPVPESATEVNVVEEPAPEPTPEPVKPKRVVIEPSLFGDDEMWSRPAPTTSRRKIISLYGEDDSEPKPKSRHRRKSAAVEVEPPTEVVVEPTSEPKSQIDIEPGVVLADTIATPTTIADSIPAQPRVGESGAVDTLRSSISVGDRFMLIRELFGGNEAEYEATIDKLDGMDNLDDCIIYIAENFVWRASSDGAKLIMDLLQRKLC